MKLIRILAVICLALPLLGRGQGLSAPKCLAEAPEAVIPLIDKNTRLDMIDYFMAGQSKASANKAMGSCSIVEMSDSSVTFMLTDSVRCQLFVLNPDSEAPVIGVITTYSDPMPDSSVAFYNTRWQKLPSAWAQPGLSAWLTPEGARSRAKVEEEVPFILATFSYSPSTGRLVATNRTDRYFVSSDAPGSLALLKPELAYAWDGKRFKPVSK